MDGWNTILFGFGLFSGANLLLVSGRSEGDFAVFPRKKIPCSPGGVPFSSTRNHEADIAGQLHLAFLGWMWGGSWGRPSENQLDSWEYSALKKNTCFFWGGKLGGTGSVGKITIRFSGKLP